MKVILDTDIGTDVDDILALTLLLKDSSVDLAGVTTVYGDTALRARLARRLCELLGREDVPVYAGEREPMSGREVFWTGHEGIGMPDIDGAEFNQDKDAVTFLRETAEENAGSLELLAIGPLTNLGRAIDGDSQFAGRIKHLHMMGGDFLSTGRRAEHNIKCDTVAADIVMRAGIPTTAYGLNVTTQVPLESAELERLDRSGQVGHILAEQIRIWWRFKNETFNHLHDPLAALGMIDPSVCTFERADCTVRMDGEMAGETITVRNPDASFSYASDVNVALARQRIVDRICA